jgi:4-hydroxy-tetrahydrodipicolinate synthase
MAKLILKGLVPALTTPFAADGRLDLVGFRKLVNAVVADGVHGVLVNGCTGESWAVDDQERAALFRAAVEEVRGRVPVVAGCGAITARQARHRVEQASTAGCDAVLIQPPYYAMPGEQEVEHHFRAVADRSPLPVVVYNIPRRTGVPLSPDLVDRLANLPNVVALKESSKDFLVLSEMVRRVSGRIPVMAGYMGLLGLGALSIGAAGFMDSATPVMGKRALQFYEAALAGDLDTARRLQDELAQLSAVFARFGTFPVAVKAALDFVGRPGGFPREPLLPLDAAQREGLRAELVALGIVSPSLQGARA